MVAKATILLLVFTWASTSIPTCELGIQSLGILNVEMEFFNVHAGKIQLGR